MPIKDIQLEKLKLFKTGKVRSIFEVGDNLLLVASDRLSAFDVIMNQPIPYKGAVLTQVSAFWFEKTKDISKNHIITTNIDEYPEELQQYKDKLAKRSMLCKKAEVLPVECIVRGYIIGSGWKDYKKTGGICGIKLPEGLQQAQKLPEVIFTPSTKAEIGTHDENITFDKVIDMIGTDVANYIKETSIKLYQYAHDYAEPKGIIIADTKFEFGKIGDEIVVVDEMLTPDSSRFWPKDTYKIGTSPESYDKQYVRDYLETLDWGKTPPPPDLPEEVINNTSKKYLEAYERLTGKKL
ncbi:phosphoribosylaminoimidazolesuccinocarboxamide synthase [Candidatus Margulisiibacteriota bacterium]